MNEQHLQDKFLVPFFVKDLGYQEVKANTLTSSLIIEEDLEAFISQTSLNKTAYHDLLKKYHNDRKQLLADVIALLQERIASSRNMALFINANKSFTLQGIKLHLFYPSDSVIHGNTLFEQNIFSVVQELPYRVIYQQKKIFSFRPDLCFFINGIYLGYSELKSNYTGQTASKNGRGKVIKDYLDAVYAYYQYIDIGWSALQLKDLRRNGEYVYDKIMIVVDRVQLRDQIDSKMLNMNIDNKMYMEIRNKTNLQEALKSDTRIVIVNLQKFGAIKELLDADVLAKLASLRIVFLIDEIHRSNSGDQHDNMVNIFDELQTAFDVDSNYNKKRSKKNLIIGFTATPDDHTLARFGEFSGYAEGEKLWIPFDSYTMKEAIDDKFILNPLENIVPIASKMIFALPDNPTEGVSDTRREYKDVQKKADL
jgi:type I site-specific restriction-modification system R (restriction) subunit